MTKRNKGTESAFKSPGPQDLRVLRGHLWRHGHRKLNVATAFEWAIWHTVEHAIYGQDHRWIVKQAREEIAKIRGI